MAIKKATSRKSPKKAAKSTKARKATTKRSPKKAASKKAIKH